MRKWPIAIIFLLIFSLLTISSALAAFDSASFNANEKPLKVLRMTPTGEDVPASRQIVFTFNRPVVPVGKMDRDASQIPVSIEPSLKCEWRWLNTSSLACQLTEEAAMNLATRYTVTMRPGITTEDGSTIAEPATYSFITQRPTMNYAWFKTWRSPGTPVIRLNFDQYVTKESVAEHIFMSARDPLTVEEDPDYKKYRDYKPGRVWLVSPAEELPLDTKILLRIEPGIVSTEGPEPGVERRTLVEFHTFPKFRFLGVSCYTNSNRRVTINPGDDPQFKMCDPLRGATLKFSSPIIKEELKKGLNVSPDLAGGRKDYDPWDEVYSYSNLSRSHSKNDYYTIRLPILKAFETYTLEAKAMDIKDEFARPLAGDIAMEFKTDHRSPNFHLSNPFFVLEKGVDTEVPMVVTNLKKVEFDYEVETTKGKTEGKRTLQIDKAEDIAYKIPLNTRELIPGLSGVVQTRFESTPGVSYKDKDDKWFFSQVSPYNVHVKVGHFTTLVWVTDFATGKPVKGVEIEVYKDVFSLLPINKRHKNKLIDGMRETLTSAVTNGDGIAELDGSEKLDPELQLLDSLYWWSWNDGPVLFVRAKKGADMAVVPLVYHFQVEERGANESYISSNLKRKYNHMHTWGTTAQGVYKAGDKIQYKFYVRNQDNLAFVPPPDGLYHLKVQDPMGKTVHEVKDITLSEFGSYDGEFAVPKTGAVGWYSFELTSNFKSGRWYPMRVLVSDFTPAPFRVKTDLNGELFKDGDKLEISTSARLHAGGPYVNAQTRVTARIVQRSLRPKDPRAKGFKFDVSTQSYRSSTINQTEANVDNKGDLVNEFIIKDSPILYGKLTVESAVRDDRGKYVASQAQATYVGRDRFVGIDQKDWVLKQGVPATVEAVVVDEHGNAVAETQLTIKIEYRKTTISRVKGAGNAYLTQYKHKWVEVESCLMFSKTEPTSCKFKPKETGTYRMTASIKDTLGRPHSSQLSRWVIGKGRVLWETRPGNSLQIFSETEDLKIGDVARYMVQNPYPGAKALITIERYGVIKSWVKTFKNSTEIVEFPVLPEYLPGFYLSVVVTSPRVDKPINIDQVDLGKPAFKMGYVRVPVTDPYKEITVEVKVQKEIYKPRERVKVDIKTKIRTKDRQNKKPPMELAVAVLDESVFDLIKGGERYFDPYKGFYYLEPLDLKNFDLLMQLVGRQNFEKKGADTGGGAGMDIGMRSLFKFVSYWNPSVKTDKAGKATIEFDVPDNLTGWRVLVMAVTKSDRMGLGDANFKVNLPTEIRPALPNQATEGDSFEAGFTVMNRTDKTRTLQVRISATGPVENTIETIRTIVAEPYKRYKLWHPVKTTDDGEITFTVRAGDSLDYDALTKSMPVNKRASLETAATYGTTVSDEVTETIAFPEGIRTDVGRVSIVASPSVIGNVEGAFKYLRDYPYLCWEQILSKGVMASHYQNLKAYMPKDFKWEESEGLTEKTLALAAEHQAPNGGMVYYIPEDRYVSPYLSAYTAIAFNWLSTSGHKIPIEVEERLHGYLEKLLRRDVMPTFYSKGMSSTVRAVALAALAEHGKVTLSDIRRHRVHLKEMSLFGKAHYLQALLKLDATADMRSEVVDMILAHSNQTGGKFIFSEEVDSGYARILATPLRDNCAILSSLLQYSETPQGEEEAGEIPFKLVRTITQTRGQSGRWENTQENLFCMNSLIDFSRLYENEKPEMTLNTWLDMEPMGGTYFKDLRDEAKELERPIKEGDPGRKATVRLERRGKGRLYYSTRLFYAPAELKTDPINSGIEVRREYSVERDGEWIILDTNMELETGELVRVDIFLSLPTARNFVVVDDPVPGGLEPVNRDLATTSTVDADKGETKRSGASFWYRYDDWRDYGYSRWSFYHKELRHHAVRFYSEYLPAGNYHLSYVAQAIAPGEFSVMPLHAEEMYDPDVFGKGRPATLNVDKAE